MEEKNVAGVYCSEIPSNDLKYIKKLKTLLALICTYNDEILNQMKVPTIYVFHPECNLKFKEIFIERIKESKGKVENYIGTDDEFIKYCNGLYDFISDGKESELADKFLKDKTKGKVVHGSLWTVKISPSDMDEEINRVWGHKVERSKKKLIFNIFSN